MQELTVTCGCGRKMRVDTLRGKGAYRCGCGARVSVTYTGKGSCVALNREEKQCPFIPVFDSMKLGVSLCKEHLKGYQMMIEVQAAEEHRRWQFLNPPKLDPRYLEGGREARRSLRLDEAKARGTMVVYYMRIGSNIKIGWTTNLKQRITALMPDEVLATEPGPQELERVRHKQFAHLRVPPGRERFKPDPELVDHIAMLREHYGEAADRYPVESAETLGA